MPNKVKIWGVIIFPVVLLACSLPAFTADRCVLTELFVTTT